MATINEPATFTINAAVATAGTIKLEYTKGGDVLWAPFIADVPVQAPPPQPAHDFSLYAGRTDERRIVLCSRCGVWKSAADPRDWDCYPCSELEPASLRVAFEHSIMKAQRHGDWQAMFASSQPKPRSDPAYQNVSAVVRNVVGGWNRRERSR